MTKKEWLERKVFVDLYGRPYNLSDVPMTYMTFDVTHNFIFTLHRERI